MKEYIIYTPWLAYALRKAGFRILHTGINPHKPHLDTWYFEDTPELQTAITKITSRKSK